ncbi:Mitochondrial translocator assembly and maintenance protein 41, partial [Linnemannia exigua]
MLIPLLTSPGTIARCQQQGLRYIVAWTPKDGSSFSQSSSSDQLASQNSSQRTQGQIARYSTRARTTQSSVSVLQNSGSSATLFDHQSSIHGNSIRALSSEATASSTAAVSVNNNNSTNNNTSTSTSSNGPKTGTFTATAPVRQRRPNYIRDFEVPADMSRLPPKFGDNQHIDIDDATWQQLKSVVDSIHHKAPIRYAFAYGSGVFAQKGYDSK